MWTQGYRGRSNLKLFSKRHILVNTSLKLCYNNTYTHTHKYIYTNLDDFIFLPNLRTEYSAHVLVVN